MLKEIKKELLNNPEKLKDLLEHFNFYNVHIHQSYISFGRAQDASKKSIVIRLEKNDYLYVTDMPVISIKIYLHILASNAW